MNTQFHHDGPSFTSWRTGLLPLIAAGILTIPAPTRAQAWQTVDDAEGATSERVYSVTTDSSGNVFTAGTIVDATGRYHAVIMKSSDSGGTWSTVVDYPGVDNPPPYPPGNGVAATFHKIVSANVGGENHLVATGVYRRAQRPGVSYTSYIPQWLIIRSKDGGSTWETMDEYMHPTYQTLAPRDVAVDGNGSIYVVQMAPEYTGELYKSPYLCHWLIRKGVPTPGGMTWTTVGDFIHGDGWDSSYGHGYDADGPSGVTCVGTSVFVVGGGSHSWIVRKSSNGGSTWQVVDTYQYGKNLKSHAFDVAADSAGNVYVVGYGQKLGTRWVVRRLANGGTKWSTVDDFRLSGGSYAEGKSLAVDANNNVHVTGMAATSQGKWNWVTRQRSAATGAWSTTDLYSLAASQDTEGRAITAGSSGTLFAAGSGYDAAGVLHGWLVRRRLTP